MSEAFEGEGEILPSHWMHCMDMLYVSSSSERRQSQNQIQPWHTSASPPTHSTPHFAGWIFVELWPTGQVKGVWLNIHFCSKCWGWQKSQHSLITPPLDWPDRCYWLVQVVCFISRFWPSTVSQVSCYWESSVVAESNAEYGCRSYSP